MRTISLLTTLALFTFATACSSVPASDPASFPNEPRLQTRNHEVLAAVAAEPLTDLHYDPRRLHTAAARLLADPTDKAALAYLNAPDVLGQSDLTTNPEFARLIGLLNAKLPEPWKRDFFRTLADKPLLTSSPVYADQVAALTSALLYAQLLSHDTAAGAPRIAAQPAAALEASAARFIGDFVQSCYASGVHSARPYPLTTAALHGFLNLYDFSPNPDTRLLARAALDYHFACASLRVFNADDLESAMGGPINENVAMIRAFLDAPNAAAAPSFFAATTTYRPSRVLTNILAHDTVLPQAAHIAYPGPTAHEPGKEQEGIYIADTFALRAAYVTTTSLPAPSALWSLQIKSGADNVVLTGGHPLNRSPLDRSVYTQTMQYKGLVFIMSAGTSPPKGDPTPEQNERLNHGKDSLNDPPAPKPDDAASILAYWQAAPLSTHTWLFVPRNCLAKPITKRGETYTLQVADTDIFVTPYNADSFWIKLPPAVPPALAAQFAPCRQVLEHYDIFVCRGEPSGFAVEAVRHGVTPGMAVGMYGSDAQAIYQTATDETIEFNYEDTGLRPTGALDGVPFDFAHWAHDGQIDSPSVKLKGGVLTLSDGHATYLIDYQGPSPVIRH